MKQFQAHIISETAPLTEALSQINTLSGSVMTLLVVDSEGRMTGTLTDGDVRRALINGAGLNDQVCQAMKRDFRSLPPDASVNEIRNLRRMGLRLLPVIDSDRRIISVLDLQRQHTLLPVRAVLMAGGRGERLRPLTDTVPKPLLKVGDQCIIARNIDALRRCGVTDITVTTRYLADMIESHFAGSEVKCLRENEPLGTIGALSLMPCGDPQGTTLLMNSDLLTSISFEEMFLRHSDTGADITIATVSHSVSIPFAILTVDGDRVTGIEEKPTYTHYANAGIYMISNRLLEHLPCQRLDAPDFIRQAMEQGAGVTYYPISGTWLDVGSPADFRQACELMRHHLNFNN